MHQPARGVTDLRAVGVGALHSQPNRLEPLFGKPGLFLDDVVFLIQVRNRGLQGLGQAPDDLRQSVLVDLIFSHEN